MKRDMADESMHKKARLACISTTIFVIAAMNEAYFNNVTNRVMHYQAKALAGEVSFENPWGGYLDKHNPFVFGVQNEYDFYEQTNLKDLKYGTEKWAMYTRQVDGQTVYDSSQGNVSDTDFYGELRADWGPYQDTIVKAQQEFGTDLLKWNEYQYNQWFDFRENLIWFDTAPCFSGKLIGQVNDLDITSGTPAYYKEGDKYIPVGSGWWTRTDTRYVASGDGFVASNGADYSVTGSVNYPDLDLQKDLFKSLLDMVEDCDFDCQKKGSRMSTIAALMTSVWTFIMLQACCMCCGINMAPARIFSVYCALVNWLLQLILTAVAMSFFFTKYNAVCARSTAETGPMDWKMFDDFMVTGSLLIFSILIMTFICMCGV